MKDLMLVGLIGLGVLLFSCNETEEASKEVNNEKTVTEEVQEGLYLKDGQKWEVPADMMWQIQSQRDRLFEYDAAGDITYLQLGNELDSLCKELVTICTMKGEAHNVLHAWLLPHWGLIDAINSSQDAKEADDYVEKLWLSFKTFDEYFE